MHQTDSVVHTTINRLNQECDEYGIRDLVKHCQMTDKTITKAIRRLEQAEKIRVIRGGRGRRNLYVILHPPSEEDRATAQTYLNDYVGGRA